MTKMTKMKVCSEGTFDKSMPISHYQVIDVGDGHIVCVITESGGTGSRCISIGNVPEDFVPTIDPIHRIINRQFPVFHDHGHDALVRFEATFNIEYSELAD